MQALSIRISNNCPGSPRIVYVCLPGNSHKSDSCDPHGYVVPIYNTASAWLQCFSWQHFLSPALLLVTMAQGSMIESYCIDPLSLVPVPGQVCVREPWGCCKSLPAYFAGWTFLTHLQTDQHQNHFPTVCCTGWLSPTLHCPGDDPNSRAGLHSLAPIPSIPSLLLVNKTCRLAELTFFHVPGCLSSRFHSYCFIHFPQANFICLHSILLHLPSMAHPIF